MIDETINFLNLVAFWGHVRPEKKIGGFVNKKRSLGPSNIDAELSFHHRLISLLLFYPFFFRKNKLGNVDVLKIWGAHMSLDSEMQLILFSLDNSESFLNRPLFY